eukprot:Hpha_TRINITY_DN13761_c0_g2::TRINITY_DN13761_c0_g2_i1::g.142837::m.142837
MSGGNWCDVDVPFYATGEEMPLKPLDKPPADWEKIALSDRGYYCLVSGPQYGYFPHPPFVSPASFADMKDNFKLRGDDVVIATYPKCGTTWMQQIVLLLLAEGDKARVVSPFVQSPWLEMSSGKKSLGIKDSSNEVCPEEFRVEPMNAEEFNKWEPPASFRPAGAKPRRVFKTHAPPHVAPWQGGMGGVPSTARIIVVSRGPRDQAISLLHHMKGTKLHFKYDPCDQDHMFKELWGRGRVESGDFYSWHQGWWEAGLGKEQLLWLRFEDMKEDPVGSVRKVAAFLNIPASDEVILKVTEASSFGAMKEQFQAMEKKGEEAGVPVKKDHIRKGESGGWRSALTPEQQEWFAKHDAKRRGETGLSFEAVADS